MKKNVANCSPVTKRTLLHLTPENELHADTLDDARRLVALRSKGEEYLALAFAFANGKTLPELYDALAVLSEVTVQDLRFLKKAPAASLGFDNGGGREKIDRVALIRRGLRFRTQWVEDVIKEAIGLRNR